MQTYLMFEKVSSFDFLFQNISKFILLKSKLADIVWCHLCDMTIVYAYLRLLCASGHLLDPLLSSRTSLINCRLHWIPTKKSSIYQIFKHKYSFFKGQYWRGSMPIRDFLGMASTLKNSKHLYLLSRSALKMFWCDKPEKWKFNFIHISEFLFAKRYFKNDF